MDRHQALDALLELCESEAATYSVARAFRLDASSSSSRRPRPLRVPPPAQAPVSEQRDTDCENQRNENAGHQPPANSASFWRDTSLHLKLPLDVVVARVNAGELSRFTVPQLRTLNQCICSRVGRKFRVSTNKAEWIASTRALVALLNGVVSDALSVSEKENTATIPSLQTPTSKKYVPICHTIASVMPVNTVNTSPSTINTAITTCASPSSLKLKVKAHFVEMNLSSPASKLLVESETPPNASPVLIASHFRNPLIARGASTPPATLWSSPLAKNKSFVLPPNLSLAVSPSPSLTPKKYQALNRSRPKKFDANNLDSEIVCDPPGAHVGFLTRLAQQIPEDFLKNHDFVQYLCSDSKLPNLGGGRQYTLHFNLKQYYLSSNSKDATVHLFVQIEALSAMTSSNFGLPPGTAVVVKIGTLYSKTRVLDMHMDSFNISDYIQDAGQPIEGKVHITLVFPTNPNSVVNCLIIGLTRLSLQEIVLKMYQQEAVRQGILSNKNQLVTPNFWCWPILWTPQHEFESLRKKLVANCNNGFASINKNVIPSDVIASDTTVSFLCPISLTRMQTPGRGKTCTHMQSFDIQTYLKLNNNVKEPWKCVLCMKRTGLSQLILDIPMMQLLDAYPDDIRCIVKMDGTHKKAQANADIQTITDCVDSLEIADSEMEEEDHDSVSIVKKEK
ncbi:hypothetical protein BC830DRAFT_1137391 [Chytriomyces sp. MP71]|nr:hypothetical protein BC830DRAFT_1137391 [Chytriomyces sp. MP71]